jgi:hypothetical protein
MGCYPECGSRINIIDANVNGAYFRFTCRQCGIYIQKTSSGRMVVIIALLSVISVRSQFGFISLEFALSFFAACLLIIFHQHSRSMVEIAE